VLRCCAAAVSVSRAPRARARARPRSRARGARLTREARAQDALMEENKDQRKAKGRDDEN
jgi:hypothetical protein